MSTTFERPTVARPRPQQESVLRADDPLEGFHDPPPGFGRYPWWTPLVALVAGLALMAPVALLLDHAHFPFEGTIGEGLIVAALLGVGLVLMRRTGGSPALADLGLRSTPSRAAVGWIAVAWFTYAIVASIYIQGVHGVTPNVRAHAGGDHPSTVAVIDAIVALAVLAPIGEELFFRGFLYSALRGRLPVFWAALASAGLFGAIHPIYGSTAWNLVPVLALGGFAMCMLYERTGSLWASIGFHVSMNVLALCVIIGSAIPLAVLGAIGLLFLLAPWRWFSRSKAAQSPESRRSIASAQSRAASATVE